MVIKYMYTYLVRLWGAVTFRELYLTEYSDSTGEVFIGKLILARSWHEAESKAKVRGQILAGKFSRINWW